MERIKRLSIPALLVPGMILALAGCAGAPVDKTLQDEELLGTAGFRFKMADTPAKFARIRRLPRNRSCEAGSRARSFMSGRMRRAAAAITPVPGKITSR
jgi:hypothetical protein